MARIVPATEEWIRTAAAVIRSGGVVAFPTETVYGLGANALDSGAVARIFAAKGRPSTNPLIVHVASLDDVAPIALTENPYFDRLAAAFWPGPLTVILPKRVLIPEVVTAGGQTVGVRVPSHSVALRLLRAANVPIAAPSANRSESVSPTTAAHVACSLGDAIDLILDGGPCTIGLESTVLNLTAESPEILRPGAITAEHIERVIGTLPNVRTSLGASTTLAQSPGQMPRHYAPMTPLRLSNDALDEAGRTGLQVAVITHEPSNTPIRPIICQYRMPDNAPDYARLLYATLRAADELRCACIYVQNPPRSPEWAAVRDRLARAAAPKSSATQ